MQIGLYPCFQAGHMPHSANRQAPQAAISATLQRAIDSLHLPQSIPDHTSGNIDDTCFP